MILVVDDTPQNVRLMDAILTSAGYAVGSAARGEEALELIETNPPDLVVLDWLMPGLKGHEVCQKLRASPVGEFLPVIMVTSIGEEMKVQAIESGADDFISRPVNPAELLARI